MLKAITDAGKTELLDSQNISEPQCYGVAPSDRLNFAKRAEERITARCIPMASGPIAQAPSASAKLKD
jgi:hypothetical protein